MSNIRTHKNASKSRKRLPPIWTVILMTVFSVLSIIILTNAVQDEDTSQAILGGLMTLAGVSFVVRYLVLYVQGSTKRKKQG